MYQTIDPIVVTNFAGGINKSTTVDNIADNELDECLNMDINPDGSLSSRPGVDQFNSTLTGAGRVTSLYYAKDSTGANTARIVTTLAKVYKDDGAGGWTDITGTTAPPSDTLWMWRTFNNLAIGVNGTSVPQKYAFGAALADLTGTPPDKCKIIEVNRGRVYLAGDGDEPTALSACAASNASDWTTAGDAFKIFVDKDNGHPITGLAKFFTDLIIFKRKGVYKLDNPDNNPSNMQIIQIFDDVGCISPYSIKQIGNELVWLDDDGVYSLQATQNFGDVAYSSITRKVQPYVDDMDIAYLPYSYCMDSRKYFQYRLAYPNGSNVVNTKILVRDYFHGAWTRREGINMASFGKWDIGGKLYDMGGGYDGKVYKLDQLTDDEGADYTKTVNSKRFTFGTSRLRKFFHRVYHEFQTNGTYAIGFTADIEYGKILKALSFVSTVVSSLWDVAKWDVDKWGGGQVFKKDTNIGKKGRSIQLKYNNSVKDQPYTLYKFEIDASMLGRKG